MTTQTVNLKLVESLLQAIAALSAEEQHIVRSRLIYPNGTTAPAPKRSVLEILAEAHQLPAYRTPEEIDRDIQAERDSWDN
jgi:hypothetical protein